MKNPIRNKLKIRNMFSGIALKFILYFILFSIIPIIFISTMGYNLSEEIVIKQNLQYLDLQNHLLENRLHNLIRQARFEISTVNPANQAFSWMTNHSPENSSSSGCKNAGSIASFLREKISNSDYFLSLSITDRKGKVLCSTDSILKHLPETIMSKLLTSDVVYLPPSALETERLPTNTLLVSKDLEDQFKSGYIIGFINNKKIEETISYFSGRKTGYNIFILDSTGQQIFSTTDNLAKAGSSLVWRKDQLIPRGKFIERDSVTKVLRAFSTFEKDNWYIISEVTYQTAMADLIILRNQAVLGVGILLILLIGLAFYVSQRVSVPIRQLVYAAQDIGDGLLYSPIKIRSGDEIGLLANELDNMRQSLLDYTENLEKKVQKRSEELKKAQFQIMHQEKMASIGLLAAGIAHEIGNPITSISSLTQLLKRRLKNEDNLNYLATIMKNIERISRIVRELVDFSRPSHYEARPTDINEVAHAAIGIVKYDKRSHNINFHTDFDTSLPRIILVADHLLQVFINILFNAVDAMDGFGNNLTVKTRTENHHATIKIIDTGCGIPEDKINKIFEPFYTTKGVGKGTGLGLSVSYGIIRNLKGDIFIESREGKGSTFTIKIPMNRET